MHRVVPDPGKVVTKYQIYNCSIIAGKESKSYQIQKWCQAVPNPYHQKHPSFDSTPIWMANLNLSPSGLNGLLHFTNPAIDFSWMDMIYAGLHSKESIQFSNNLKMPTCHCLSYHPSDCFPAPPVLPTGTTGGEGLELSSSPESLSEVLTLMLPAILQRAEEGKAQRPRRQGTHIGSNSGLLGHSSPLVSQSRTSSQRSIRSQWNTNYTYILTPPFCCPTVPQLTLAGCVRMKTLKAVISVYTLQSAAYIHSPYQSYKAILCKSKS